MRKRDSKRRQAEDLVEDPPADGRGAGGVFAATLNSLVKAGRVESPAGQNALALATRIDWGATDTGSSIAALSKQHLAALDEALKDIAAASDPVDELQRRRQSRVANA